MKVVGLSGAQGGGKSSLLKELNSRGWRVDDFRVSRAVQAELGWTSLDDVMTSPETMIQFQEEVYRQKYNHDLTLAVKADYEFEPAPYEHNIQAHAKLPDARDGIILTERTFADIWAYTSLWTWRLHENGRLSFNEAMNFLAGYTKKCAEAQNKIYEAVLILPFMGDVVKWENDPNRARKEDINTVFEDIERFIERKQPLDSKKLKITAKSIEDRADQVELFLRTL